MTLEQLIALISILLSIVSTVIAVVSLRRTAIYEYFDYAARLDIEDELVQFARCVGEQTQIASMGSGAKGKDLPRLNKDKEGFGYRASLKNKGEKGIPIASVHMDYGAKDDTDKRVKYVLEGKFHLASGEDRQVEFSLSYPEIEKTMQNLGIQQCLFWLRVTYENPNGKRLDLIRPLGGL
jgi:hypothetical protein